MAQYSHPDLEETLRGETPEAVDLLGQPSSARVITEFVVRQGADLAAIVGDLVNEAEEGGWEFEPEQGLSDDGERFIATKSMPVGLAELLVVVAEDSNNGDSDLYVRLEFRRKDRS